MNEAFNQEIKKRINEVNYPVLTYLKEKLGKYSTAKCYLTFFDDFLVDYGIASIWYMPAMNGTKYVPYINCNQNNIFNEDPGFTYLSDKQHSPKECQQIMARYLIGKLMQTKVEDFENWNFDFNQNNFLEIYNMKIA